MPRKRTVTHKFDHRSEPAFTRLKYIKRAGKGSKVAKFTVGSTGDYSHELELVALRERFVPDVVLESVRVALGHALIKIKDKTGYIFRIIPYPHHILRENKLLGVAKAERMQTGMRLAFGKPIGIKAAHIKRNQPIIKLWVYEKDIPLAKNALRIAKNKIGLPCKINIEKSSGSPRVVKKEIEKKKIEPMIQMHPKKGIE